MVAITTQAAPSGEWYEVKAGVVSLQLNNCVIHGSGASEANFSQWGAIQIQLPFLLPFWNYGLPADRILTDLHIFAGKLSAAV